MRFKRFVVQEINCCAVSVYFQTKKVKKGTIVTVNKWFGNRKEVAAVRTVCSHISNMVTGVTVVSVLLVLGGCGGGGGGLVISEVVTGRRGEMEEVESQLFEP